MTDWSLIKKLKRFWCISWIKTILFCFYHLPFKQACKIPILIYRGEGLGLKGKIEIDSEKIWFGMIQLGYRWIPVVPFSGMILTNRGKIIFKGKCSIGNASSIRVHKNGCLIFGSNVVCTHKMIIDCYQHIEFKDNCRVAWNVTFMDSSQHRLKNKEGQYVGSDFKPIIIGKNNWIATGCLVLKGAKTNDYTIFAANSILNKDYTGFPMYCLMAGTPLEVKKEGIWRDVDDDGTEFFASL